MTTLPSLADRVLELGESATLAVSRRATELRSRGVAVVDLGVGQPDFPSPERAVRAAHRALDEGMTRYAPTPGTPALRDAVAAEYAERWGAPWEADQVVITVGAKAALLELAQALFQPGRRAVVSSPYWVSIPAQIRLAGGEVVAVETSPKDGFALHADALLAACDERTVAVYINAPCNPTGAVIAADGLERLVAGCAERGIWLVADETYERYVYDGRDPVSVAALARAYPETVVLVGSFSKTWAMTGWRLGYLLGPPQIVDAVVAVQGHATSGPTTFAMPGALAALQGGEEEFAAHLAEFQARRNLLLSGLEGMPGVDVTIPAGAFYAFPHISSHFESSRENSAEFASWLLEEVGVAVVPGAAFGAEGHIRLSYACSRETLEEAIRRLARALGEDG